MSDTERATISSHFARVMLERAIALGCDPQPLLSAAELGDDPAFYARPRISPQQLGALMRAFWRESDDELMGFGAGRHRFGTFALMARYTVSCTDLREALAYSIRFYNLVSPSLRWQLLEKGGAVELRLRLLAPQQDVARFLEEFMLLVWHRYFNWLVGTRIPLQRTRFAFVRPQHSAEHAIMFPGPLEYQAEHTGLLFAQSFLDQPVVRHRSDLRHYLAHLPDEWFIKQVFDASTADRLYHSLMESSRERFPAMAEVAHAWHTTTRTLHRHLVQEQTSFREVRDQVRRDRAINWLLEESCQVGEVARRLGMSEPGFSRAFKKWTGFTPLVYRKTRSQYA